MKRGILLATLMVTVAGGMASASLLTAASRGAAPAEVAAEPQARPAVPAVAKVVRTAEVASVVPVAPVAKAPSAPAAPVVQKASVEARQAPVPLQVKPRPAVVLKDVEATAKTEGKSGDTANAPVAADGFNENAAKAAIEADGYKGVKVLRKGVNGIWHATALRGQTPVTVTVDASGSVSSN